MYTRRSCRWNEACMSSRHARQRRERELVQRAVTIGAALLLTAAICDCGGSDDDDGNSGPSMADGSVKGSHASGSGSNVVNDSGINAVGAHSHDRPDAG